MRFSCPGSSIKRQGGHFYIIDLILVGTKGLTNPHLLRLPLLTFYHLGVLSKSLNILFKPVFSVVPTSNQCCIKNNIINVAEVAISWDISHEREMSIQGY